MYLCWDMRTHKAEVGIIATYFILSILLYFIYTTWKYTEHIITFSYHAWRPSYLDNRGILSIVKR